MEPSLAMCDGCGGDATGMGDGSVCGWRDAERGREEAAYWMGLYGRYRSDIEVNILRGERDGSKMGRRKLDRREMGEEERGVEVDEDEQRGW